MATSSTLFRARSRVREHDQYNYLGLAPKGRDEDGLPFTMSWLRHHDRYEDGRLEDTDRPYWPAEAAQS